MDTAIMRDLNRTFPNHIFFMDRQGPGQRSLYTVLRAYSSHDRKVRACMYVCVWGGGEGAAASAPRHAATGPPVTRVMLPPLHLPRCIS